MYITFVYNLETDMVETFWWSDLLTEANEIAAEYRLKYHDSKYETCVECRGGTAYNLDNAIGY